jgi:S1-C subfamily serine protease
MRLFLIGLLLLAFRVLIAEAEDMRYWTSYSRPLDAMTDQQIKGENEECNREVRTAMSGGFNVTAGPLWWIELHNAIAGNKAERTAKAMLRRCMEAKGWREVNGDDIEHINKRGIWTNYPEPRELMISISLTCVRDMAAPDVDSPAKPLRIDADLYDKCMTGHGLRRVSREEADRIRLLRHQQQKPSEPQRTEATAALTLYGTATGFLVNDAGDVLTAAHALSGCREIRAGAPGATVKVAQAAALDSTNDLGVVKLPARASRPATFREGRGVRQGDSVVVFGFPLRAVLASGPNLTTGTISALAGLGNDSRYLQVTAPVQPGNSGGPLLDESGNVVGVVVSKLDAIKVATILGDIPQNVNFAVNASVARTFLDANGVAYVTAAPGEPVSSADVGQRAKAFTVLIECWK